MGHIWITACLISLFGLFFAVANQWLKLCFVFQVDKCIRTCGQVRTAARRQWCHRGYLRIIIIIIQSLAAESSRHRTSNISTSVTPGNWGRLRKHLRNSWLIRQCSCFFFKFYIVHVLLLLFFIERDMGRWRQTNSVHDCDDHIISNS